MNIKCPNCGSSNEFETCNSICPYCGWDFSSGYEEMELTDNKGSTTKVIRLHSGKEVYYEYTPNTTPLYEDAWGRYFLGKCYSQEDSRFLKKITVCLINRGFYVSSMWKHIKKECIDFSGTAFIPIIDYISCSPILHYLVEDYFDGVSLYDLMCGQVCGVDGQPIGFAAKMYEMYLSRKIDFAKKVVKEILKEINNIHQNDIALRFIELPENIIFTVKGELKIRIRGSLLSVCELRGTIIPRVFLSLWPVEYAPPEKSGLCERNESFEIYVVGILLYCILTGHLPYKSCTSLEKCHQAHEPYVDPRDEKYKEKPHVGLLLRGYDDLLLNDIQDEHLKRIIKKATSLVPSKRFQSASEFLNALEDSINACVPWYKKIISFFLV